MLAAALQSNAHLELAALRDGGGSDDGGSSIMATVRVSEPGIAVVGLRAKSTLGVLVALMEDPESELYLEHDSGVTLHLDPTFLQLDPVTSFVSDAQDSGGSSEESRKRNNNGEASVGNTVGIVLTVASAILISGYLSGKLHHGT